MFICKLSILKALPDTESAFCLSLVIVFPPFITLYLVLKLYLLLILNNNNEYINQLIN